MSKSSISIPQPAVDFLSTSRYSQATYLGRVQNFFAVIDPRTLVASEKQVGEAVALIKNYADGKREGVTQDQIWDAKQLRDSCIHPDTNEMIFPLFRFSAFVPTNIPLVIGMLGSTTPASTIFWQWANQSYNVAVNYANRNIGKNQMSNEAIALSYAGAVVSSCSIALGLGKVVTNLNKRPNPGMGLRLFRGAVPFFAVASAGVLNVVLMRLNEAREGINVKDAEGNDRGVSVKAGVKSLTEVALTRVALPAPILLFPPLLMSIWDKLPLAKSRPSWRPIVQVPVITACLWLALPIAIGLFPQQSSIEAKAMEPKFQSMKDSKGNPIQTFYFNKGL